ncbi:MAG: hypothetical protein DMF84_01545 [Acidobacteria bacterium]|nr:MAG: hypothetical protein DMF84_01545 [Acidobacteriota bacterium]
MSNHRRLRYIVGAIASVAVAAPCAAQVTPAAGYTPPDDTPSIRIGATIFADYTIQQEPSIKDAAGNDVKLNSFNVGRSYINITGNISHLIAFRITPDITRESGVGSSLNGSLTFRLKYAYAQFNLDDWMTRGSWVRFGQQQTPWVDFIEGLYRYRFQGQIFTEREGFLSSSDTGISFHYSLPGNYGDIHTGIYNGETYTQPEANNEKGYMIRATVRPLPMHPVLRGLRITGFWDQDAYLKNEDRQRGIVSATFEHTYLNGSFEYLSTKLTRAAGPCGSRRRRRSDGKVFSATTTWSPTRTPPASGTGLLEASRTGSPTRAASQRRCSSISTTRRMSALYPFK